MMHFLSSIFYLKNRVRRFRLFVPLVVVTLEKNLQKGWATACQCGATGEEPQDSPPLLLLIRAIRVGRWPSAMQLSIRMRRAVTPAAGSASIHVRRRDNYLYPAPAAASAYLLCWPYCSISPHNSLSARTGAWSARATAWSRHVCRLQPNVRILFRTRRLILPRFSLGYEWRWAHKRFISEKWAHNQGDMGVLVHWLLIPIEPTWVFWLKFTFQNAKSIQTNLD